MELLEKIEETIKRGFKITAKGGAYCLEESEVENYPPTSVKQKGKMLIYSFDRRDSNESVFPIFNDRVKGLTTICDYLIFYPHVKQRKFYVFICDLKTSKTSAKKQVESGMVLAEYIIQMARKELKFKKYDIEYRSLIFSLAQAHRFSTDIREPYIELGHSQLKNKILKAGNICYLDNLCF